MVLGILIAVIVAPGLLGSQEAIRQGQSKDKREEHRARRCNLIATCVKSSPRSREIDGRPVVLRNGKLWIDTTTEDGEPLGHTCAGYYLPYPDTKYEGLVTTITDVAPIMNWVYIDRQTHEARYGVRADAQPNLTGPFDCTRQDRRLTFDGWEGWCAVEEYEGYWCLYFDVDDNGLRSKVAPGTRVLEIELSRKEKRFKKDDEGRQQDQTTKREVDNREDAPTDRPLRSEADVRRPGVFDEPQSELETPPADDAMPKTPPPAYSKTNKPSTSPIQGRPKKGAVDALDDFLAMEVQANVTSVPRVQTQRRSTSDSPPPPPLQPQLPTPLEERRVTPKLNRNSGSKAIAQAQIFEAMAAGQTQNSDNISRRISGNKRISLASSNADSASVYSEEDQRLSREIRPQSSISQKAYYTAPVAPPVPLIDANPPGMNNSVRIDLGQPSSMTYQEGEPPADPAIFGATEPQASKRSSYSNLVSQRKRNSKVFSARRPGKRVSPRNSATKPSTVTMSSGAGSRRQPSTSKSSKVQVGTSNSGNRAQAGRKTTSTFLKDLDDLVNLEAAPGLSTSNRRAPAPEKGLPSRGEQRGGRTSTNKTLTKRI
ncbi:uncharacterized protein EKO05_0005925 [Ascochyta rabiei]|uniref:Uncharacterized protein n=1 Tax=Didymella rabiei TaxID=5454 RepID=A0A163JL57_DIDRA|nr:uncharacterized protein EKO05_0005925 [Ascochyta rabiei]KZM26432.1 hypothetical protein ST47_g2418 [Ascochyta rabiei]UPX15479.1 hypothetical protein EKO05_0005925 [Ascochyta rabiei]